MFNIATSEKLIFDEHNGEKLINKFRFSLGFIYVFSVLIVSILRNIEGYGFLPLRAFIFPALFLIYSIFLHYYLKKTKKLDPLFKYISSCPATALAVKAIIVPVYPVLLKSSGSNACLLPEFH